MGKSEVIKKTSVYFYDDFNFSECASDNLEECLSQKPAGSTSWINIPNSNDVKIIESLGEELDLHPLIIEDIINKGQRPKIEEFDKYLFIVLKMIDIDKNYELKDEQVSLVIMQDTVASCQEDPADVFSEVRERLRTNKGIIRKMGSDYLGYSLIDAIVDRYFVILEKLGDRIEDLEEELVSDPTISTLKAIHNIRRQVITLRRGVWPLREVLSYFDRCGSPLIDESTRIYIRDVYDHTVQIIDAIETNRDLLSGILDIYLTSVSNKMNEVMKFLTIIGTIFIPLTFIAGVYGMNFNYMPELREWWGYPMALIIMLIVGITMLLYFRRKKWI
ncbi:magnesium/cobalt transporter CorA [Candidatus Bathyarchaeota archaeon]|nr:magnesium/cobalt transporter CorA [Candidatus Bathyarchaeota archaeon]